MDPSDRWKIFPSANSWIKFVSSYWVLPKQSVSLLLARFLNNKQGNLTFTSYLCWLEYWKLTIHQKSDCRLTHIRLLKLQKTSISPDPNPFLLRLLSFLNPNRVINIYIKMILTYTWVDAVNNELNSWNSVPVYFPFLYYF